jgi:hypothetical protein
MSQKPIGWIMMLISPFTILLFQESIALKNKYNRRLSMAGLIGPFFILWWTLSMLYLQIAVVKLTSTGNLDDPLFRSAVLEIKEVKSAKHWSQILAATEYA